MEFTSIYKRIIIYNPKQYICCLIFLCMHTNVDHIIGSNIITEHKAEYVELMKGLGSWGCNVHKQSVWDSEMSPIL